MSRQPVQVEAPTAHAILLDSSAPRLRGAAAEGGVVAIMRESSSDQPTTAEVCDHCSTAGSGSSLATTGPAVVNALLDGRDAAVIICGGSGADQRRELLGSELPSSPSKGGVLSAISRGSLLGGIAERLFAELRELERQTTASGLGLRRTHEVRVTCVLLQHETPIDLLEVSDAAAAAAAAASATVGSNAAPSVSADGRTPPPLRLKRSHGRRGVHVSGLRSLVVTTAGEVAEAFGVAVTGLRALARPGSQAVFEVQVSQRLTARPNDPLAAYMDAVGDEHRVREGAESSATAVAPSSSAAAPDGSGRVLAVPERGTARVLSSRLRLALTEAGLSSADESRLSDPMHRVSAEYPEPPSKAHAAINAVVHALSRPAECGGGPLSPRGGGSDARAPPHRASLLTMLLSEAFGGSSRCVILALLPTSDGGLPEAMETLRLASRARRIRNRIEVNERISKASAGGATGSDVRALAGKSVGWQRDLFDREAARGPSQPPRQMPPRRRSASSSPQVHQRRKQRLHQQQRKQHPHQ